MHPKKRFLSTAVLMIMMVIPMSLMQGCSQDETAGLLTAGAEAATVAAMLTVKQELPDEATQIATALGLACKQANELLKDTKSATTLRQVLDLSFSTDPLLEKVKPVVDFCLPVLENITVVSAALDKPISELNGSVNAYAQAFFNGMAAGLSVPAGTTVEALRASDPMVDKAVKRSVRRFDTVALSDRLKALKVKK